MSDRHDPADRRLDLLTTEEVRAIPKADALVVQPIGAFEQHGPHLPLSTDTLIAQALTDRAIAATSASVGVWSLPALAYGTSSEHLGFPGTVSLGTDTLLAWCRDMGRSLHASGFRKLALLNGHGGQIHALEIAARDIHRETGMYVFHLFPYRIEIPEGILSAQERANDIHGGELETSLVMAIAPDAVHLDRAATAGTPRDPFRGLHRLSLEGPMPTSWVTADVAPEGVIGDPSGASAASGAHALAVLSESLAEVFAEICAFEFER